MENYRKQALKIFLLLFLIIIKFTQAEAFKNLIIEDDGIDKSCREFIFLEERSLNKELESQNLIGEKSLIFKNNKPEIHKDLASPAKGSSILIEEKKEEALNFQSFESWLRLKEIIKMNLIEIEKLEERCKHLEEKDSPFLKFRKGKRGK